MQDYMDRTILIAWETGTVFVEIVIGDQSPLDHLPIKGKEPCKDFCRIQDNQEDLSEQVKIYSRGSYSIPRSDVSAHVTTTQYCPASVTALSTKESQDFSAKT